MGISLGSLLVVPEMIYLRRKTCHQIVQFMFVGAPDRVIEIIVFSNDSKRFIGIITTVPNCKTPQLAKGLGYFREG
jgi:hypothetical protein